MVTNLRKHPTATTRRRMQWPCYNHPTATRNMDRDVQPPCVTLDMVAGRRGRWPATNRLPGSSRSVPRDTPLSRGRERLCRIAAQLRCASRPLPIVDLTDARAPARRQSPHGGGNASHGTPAACGHGVPVGVHVKFKTKAIYAPPYRIHSCGLHTVGKWRGWKPRYTPADTILRSNLCKYPCTRDRSCC